MKKERTGSIFVFAVLCCIIPVLLAGCREKAAEGALEELVLLEAPAEEIKEAKPGTDAENAEEPEDGAEAHPDADAGEQVYYLYICGAVERPGVYRVRPGDRIFAAVDAAGGFTETACREYVNLAQPVTDGGRIWIPTEEEAKALEAQGISTLAALTQGQGISGAEAQDKGADAGNEMSNLVNINTAGAEQLCTLPGIGEAKAAAIIAYRSRNGAFSKKEDIMKVSGIKQSGYEKIKELITAGQE